MNTEPHSRGSFWTSLTGMIAAIAGLLAAVGTVLAFLAANNLPPFKKHPPVEQPLPIAASPSNHSFGQVQQGRASDPFAFTVTNPRKDGVALSVAIAGDDLSSFHVAVETCSLAPVGPNGTCDLELMFSPLAEGSLAARVVLSLPGGDLATQIALTGFGLPAGELSFSPPSLYLGLISTTSKPAPFSTTTAFAVTNTGAGRVTISTIKVGDSHFNVTANCHGKVLNPGHSCTVTVTFTAISNGFFRTTLQVRDDTPGGQQNVSLVGYRGPLIFRISSLPAQPLPVVAH